MNKMIIKNDMISHCHIDNYPDGQKNVKLDLSYYSPKEETQINARIKSWQDMELLLTAIKALQRHDLIISNLNLVYLFGQRSDRAFEPGQCNYFRDVVLKVLATSGLRKKQISLLSPHNEHLIWSLGLGIDDGSTLVPITETQVRIGGDKSTGYPYHFIKHRACDGKIIDLILPDSAAFYIKVNAPRHGITVCDDLCDGGATFISAGKILKEKYPDRERYLFVVHGLFSKGFEELAKYYDKIFTTNSYQDFLDKPDFLTVIEVI